MRNTLVTALADCAENRVRARARRFLAGLSCDELLFIAEFLGACILESAEADETNRPQPEFGVKCGVGESRRQYECKMILLREYLNRSGRHPAATPTLPGAAA